jgi:hypothetical protein
MKDQKIKVIIGTANRDGYTFDYRTEWMTEAEYYQARRYQTSMYSIQKAD